MHGYQILPAGRADGPGHDRVKLCSSGRRRWPHLDRWFDAMESRETYLGLKSDFYTHVHDLPPQLGGACRCGWVHVCIVPAAPA